MNAMLRGSGEKPAERARLMKAFLKSQTAILERLGTTPTIVAMRIVEREIVAQYENIYDNVDGIARRGLLKCWHRAIKHVAVLTYHIESGTGRVCMRCLLDRPGMHGALLRREPHPYTYVCSKCHDEVLADFPPDLLEKALTWTEHDRNSHVMEKALGRPSTLMAESLVLAKLAGIAPDVPPPPTPYKAAFANDFDTALPPPDIPPRLVVENSETTEDERLYTELLFDFESVRQNW
jgi:hypothetical protein